MSLIINTNVASLNSQRYLSRNTNALNKSMEKLSSGFRINRAGDDAAGLALSESLRTQIRGSKKALDNAQDAINLLNLADGALQQIQDNLQRMRELAVQAANDTYSSEQRTAMQTEFNQLIEDNYRIMQATKFNGAVVFGSNKTFQIGANNVANVDTIQVTGAAANNALGTVANVATANWTNSADAVASITAVDSSITGLNTQRGNLGAFVNRLESAANNLSIAIENYSAAESRIRNVDVALESSNLTRNQILQQAAGAMLAQANASPQLALQLLRG
ncbi:MAG TPA: flagellin [Oculatellaceae cyanobacterium]